MENEYSFKQFNNVIIKSITPFSANGYNFEANEAVMKFDKIEIGTITQNKNYVAAHGGFNDKNLVYWDIEKSENIYFRQGTFNSHQFAFLNNSKLLNKSANTITIHKTEIKEILNNKITLSEIPLNLFVYNKSTYSKYTIGSIINKEVTIVAPNYTEVICEYDYNYNNTSQVIEFGNNVFNGYLSLEGQTVIKDSETGNLKTGIIKIPKLHLLSKLSLQLGVNAIPVSTEFVAEALPVGNRGNEKSLEFYILNNYISED